jgi:hypothetical protein
MKTDTLYDKGVGQINEDALLLTDSVFGVFDGTSSLEPYQNEEGKTGAAIVSSIARDIFSCILGDTKSLVEFAREANDAIGNAMRKKGIDTSRKTALWATTGAVVKLNDDTFDWLQIGDSLILTISHDRSFRLLIDDYDHDLETMIMWQELVSRQTENIRSVLNEQLLSLRNKMNVDYGTLDGEKEMEGFLKHGVVALDEVAHIIIFTDGLFIPKEDPRQPDDFKTFVDLFLDGGLKQVHSYVRKQETSDPKCWRYPRFKQHDDIAAIALSF